MANHNFEHNILVDKEFDTWRIELRELGYGGKAKSTRELTKNDEQMLFCKGYFGFDSNDAFQKGVCWFIAINCGFPGNDEA